MEQIPVGRLAKPEEIAWSIAFLAAERSAFMTGANLAVNGGIHVVLDEAVEAYPTSMRPLYLLCSHLSPRI